MARSGVEAARRKFTPEFMNRLDKIVMFQPLGTEELQQDSGYRTEHGAAADLQHFAGPVVRVQGDRRSQGLPAAEGTDMKYGARHLKRAIERLLVHPMSNLIATDQVRGGDWIRVDFDDSAKR